MLASVLSAIVLSNLLLPCVAVAANQNCKCVPSSPCWPSQSDWTSFSHTLSSPSALIYNVPLAAPCYPGPLFSPSECSAIDFTNSTFLANSPVGYDYPLNDGCPVLNPTTGTPLQKIRRDSLSGNETSSQCTLGNDPVMTVNATTVEDVIEAVNFASKWNIRVAVKNTGHDLLGRSMGFGSLEIWIHHLKLGITFEEKYTPSPACSASTWAGHAYTIGGGYVWQELYDDAANRGVIIVGGSEPSVGCIGGWMQGGGHSPATHNFGLGADQVLSAQIILSNGTLVTASPCQNTDLYFAIRGGGPSTYGIVISTTVKAYPTVPLTSQTLAIAPFSASGLEDFMSAVAILYSSYPDLNDQGLSGYGTWSIASPAPIFADFTTAYAHSFNLFNASVEETEAIFAPVLAKLQALNESLLISATYTAVPTYGAILSNTSQLVGSADAAIGSRLLDGQALSGNLEALQEMLNVTAGTPDQQAVTDLSLVGGGQVFKDAADPNSGVNPAWRKAYLHNIVQRAWAIGTDAATVQEIRDDLTFTKVGAMRKVAPDSGCYMNEADVNDPDYLQDFYGANADRLAAIKEKYDPESLFFCPTCIGSNEWEENAQGALCHV